MSPRPDDPAGRLNLTVNVADSQSEIMVLDSRGRLVERDFGPSREFQLDPGIYRVKVVTAGDISERSVVLTEPRTQPLEFGLATFATPAPLEATSTSHEYHQEAARRESQVTHVTAGIGASLFFLVRDFTRPGFVDSASSPDGSPARGLSLHVVSPDDERKVCDLTAGTFDIQWDAWAACTVQVDPGVYELRLALPDGGSLRQSVVASPGWQTQCFLLRSAYAANGKRVRLPDLSQTSILLAQHGRFEPNNVTLRMTELARNRLARKGRYGRKQPRPVRLPRDIRAMLEQKWTDPMLGIYGAHLLLLEEEFSAGLMNNVIANLRQLLGLDHPDVEALAMSVDPNAPLTPFAHFPMLARSWALIVDESLKRPDIVSPALAARSMNTMSSEGPWHVARWAAAAAPPTTSEPSTELTDLEYAIAEDLGVLKQARRWNARVGQGMEAGDPSSTRPRLPLLDWLRKLQGRRFRLGYPLPPFTARIDATPEQRGDIARQFGIPASQVDQVIETLDTKLTAAPAGKRLDMLAR